jgi:hypothetical protein
VDSFAAEKKLGFHTNWCFFIGGQVEKYGNLCGYYTSSIPYPTKGNFSPLSGGII